MIFNEIYGAYTRTIGAIVNAILEKRKKQKRDFLTSSELGTVISENAFGETRDKLDQMIEGDEDGKLQIITKEKVKEDGRLISQYRTILSEKYHRPITEQELRWLKTISLHPMMSLFCSDFPLFNDSDDIKPLFRPDDIVYFDQDITGDDFQSSEYISNFRTILESLQTNKPLKITLQYSEKGVLCEKTEEYIPKKLEYSQKDNRFRLIAINKNDDFYRFIRISAIKNIEILQKTDVVNRELERKKIKATIIVTDEEGKNAMQRICLCFSHLERKTEKTDETHYKLEITYDESDSMEIAIRLLSFGKYIQIIEPKILKEEVENRIKKQAECFGFL